MMARFNRIKARKSRHIRIRSRLFGTQKRPRLSVFRSHNHIYVQLIDDTIGQTLLAAASLCGKDSKSNGQKQKKETAKEVGLTIGKLAVDKGVEHVVFDRSGYKYHGRVKALADGAREAGLKF
ncbi:50S ribosomal protein L18 [Chloroflexota bacterium]